MINNLNPFAIAVILLHAGAGIWSACKHDFWSAVYFFAGAALNISVLLK